MDVEYEPGGTPVQMLEVPEGRMDEALEAMKSLQSNDQGVDRTLTLDATGTQCIHTTHHDWHCSDDT
jgi:hypothetical protein